MFIPTAFKEDDSEILLSIMRENSFATLITTDKSSKPIATPLPFLINKKNNQIVLQAHLARSNPQWEMLNNNEQVLVIFHGPHCYVSPSWYKNSGVPTWDYVTVHAYGHSNIYEDSKDTALLIEALSTKYEQSQATPWQATNNYPDKMLNAIVGFEIIVQELQGKVKIGQNKSIEDLEGVLSALDKSTSSEHEKAIAALIKNYLASKDRK